MESNDRVTTIERSTTFAFRYVEQVSMCNVCDVNGRIRTFERGRQLRFTKEERS
jgi:hypothetical protein